MTFLNQRFITLIILTTASLPVLAESVDVKVIGTIIPAACTPTVAGGGTIDYGDIKPSDLKKDDYTVLDVKTAELSISCDAATKVAINAINGRPGSLAGATEAGPDSVGKSPITLSTEAGGFQAAVVGLGLSSNQAKIGGYAIYITDPIADSKEVSLLYRNNPADTFSSSSNSNLPLYLTGGDRGVTWASSGSSDVLTFTTLNATLGIQAYINKVSELDLTQAVNLDGLTTIELEYL
ncbi:DUF1120 domain-containing protein [Serratia quinivorans]|uniref:DUF1120 domain-containing protein n=1 Tax=Serratia quinivorans TaxID=137545 RepID=UPI0034C65EE8